MPYASEIRVGVDSGSAPSITTNVTLWELSTTIDNAGRVRNQQVDQETVQVAVAGGVPFSVTTADGPSYLSRNNHSISLAAYQDGMPGAAFRSGPLETLPAGSPGDPNGLIDIMLVGAQRFTMAEINAMIPVPITLPDGNVISTATITSAPPSRNLTLVATGPYGATTYTFTLVFTIDPSNDQWDLTSVLEANLATPGAVAGGATLTFTPGPGGLVQSLIASLFQGLFIGRITQDVLSTITQTLNTTAAAAAASAAAARGFTGGVPAGVVLGARSVGVAGNGDLVVSSALGTFGSVINRFIAAAPPGRTIPCPVLMMATFAGAVDVLPALRAWRSEDLAQSVAGRELVALYYRHGAEVVAILNEEPRLRVLGRTLAESTAERLRQSGTVTPDMVETAIAFVQEVAQHGSAQLRCSIDRAAQLATPLTVSA